MTIAIRVFIAAIGVLIAAIGAIGLIGYLNLTVTGYSFYEYWHFIILQPELYLFTGGLLMAAFSFIRSPKKTKKQINQGRVE
ncbi:hypothetical protein HUG15_16100 [Salicibibacter cibarius]|uniref:Uncharacterized protein n=1 Tax=Salicibibacter cibarius TaxID=2743000 RepID=A0A7T6Z512_9BACI|nr:hypothetical protein [Salicibibacter cibarius]QQK76942.1 hypothetical protein HUG15_16100 [Salicibibacter cibarius]